MKCEQCIKEGKKSMIYPGYTTTTLAYCQPFYDEDGRHHTHDSNITASEMRCSEGHTWRESSSGSCWCGWGQEANNVEKN